MAGTVRPYIAANFNLELEGVDCGMINKFSGGNWTGEITELAQNAGYYVKKHVNNLKMNPMKMELAGIDTSPLHDKIEALLACNVTYFDGAVNALDMNLATKSTKEFKQALLTSFSTVKCDAKSTKAGYLSVEITPENVKTVKGSGERGKAKNNVHQKMLHESNFQLVVDAISGTTSRVSSVETLKASAPAAADQVGFRRVHDLICTKGAEFSNLIFVMPEIDADKAFEWHQKFCVDGYCTEQDETTAELTYYSANLKEELIRVKLVNVGVFGCEPDEYADRSDKARNVKMSAYCERFTVEFLKKG